MKTRDKQDRNELEDETSLHDCLPPRSSAFRFLLHLPGDQELRYELVQLTAPESCSLVELFLPCLKLLVSLVCEFPLSSLHSFGAHHTIPDICILCHVTLCSRDLRDLILSLSIASFLRVSSC